MYLREPAWSNQAGNYEEDTTHPEIVREMHLDIPLKTASKRRDTERKDF